MVIDLSTDENFDVELNDRNDAKFVSGRDLFEQQIRRRLTERFSELISEQDDDTIIKMAKVSARRVAREMNAIDSVALFTAEIPDDNPNRLELEIIYDTGDNEVVVI